MFAILLETGYETGRFRAFRCRWLPAHVSIPMNLGLLGFAQLGSTSNYKEWRFFGRQKGLASMFPI
jgi:hypothetical protein